MNIYYPLFTMVLLTLLVALQLLYFNTWAVLSGEVHIKHFRLFDDGSCLLGIESIILPDNYSLQHNYPNPFNPTTTISFSIPEFGFITITAYDITGKKLETLTNEVLNVGYYTISWNASSYPTGVYFIRMDSGGFTQTQKVVLLK